MSVTGTISADGNSSTHLVSSNTEVASGFFMQVSGTWGSGTLIAQYYAADETWRTLFGGSYTSDVSKQVVVPNGTLVRLNVSGSTTPSLFYQISNMSYDN